MAVVFYLDVHGRLVGFVLRWRLPQDGAFELYRVEKADLVLLQFLVRLAVPVDVGENVFNFC